MALGSRRTSPTLPSAAAVCSLPMVAPMNTPCCQSRASVTKGTVVLRRGAHRKTQNGTPRGASPFFPTRWVRGFGFRLAKIPVVALPVDQVIRLTLQTFPPDVAVIGECDVGEDGVAAGDGAHRVRVGLPVGARCHPEETELRVDRVQPAVLAEPHPGDVVAEGFGTPPRNRGLQHCQVRLPAGRREGRSEVVRLVLR